MNFARSVRAEHRPDRGRDVVVVERERDLLPVLAVGHPLERLPPDEVVVELDVAAVAEIPGREVVVLDVVATRSCRRSTPSPRSPSPAATRGTPSASRRSRPPAAATGSSPTRACSTSTRGRPPGASRTPRRPRAAPRAPAPRPPTGPKSSQPGWPTMPCRSARTGFPAIVTVVMLKNFSSGAGPPSAFSITAIAFGPWTWNRYDLRRPSVRIAQRWSSSTVDVVAAGLRVVGDPVQRRRAADEVERVLAEVEEDHVADHVALRRAPGRSASPCRPRSPRSCSRRGRRAASARPGPATARSAMWYDWLKSTQVCLPGGLLVPPVRVLGRDARVDVRAGLRVAQELDRALDACRAGLPGSDQLIVFLPFGHGRRLSAAAASCVCSPR